MPLYLILLKDNWAPTDIFLLIFEIREEGRNLARRVSNFLPDITNEGLINEHN